MWNWYSPVAEEQTKGRSFDIARHSAPTLASVKVQEQDPATRLKLQEESLRKLEQAIEEQREKNANDDAGEGSESVERGDQGEGVSQAWNDVDVQENPESGYNSNSGVHVNNSPDAGSPSEERSSLTSPARSSLSMNRTSGEREAEDNVTPPRESLENLINDPESSGRLASPTGEEEVEEDELKDGAEAQ